MQQLHYSFGKELLIPSSTLVSTSDLYTDEKGYGFIIEMNRNEQELLQIPELNSGFEPWYWLNSEKLSLLNMTEEGIYITKATSTFTEDWPIPLHFKVKLPYSGNYTLHLRLKNIGTSSNAISIFTGRRRLMSYLESLPASEELSQTFSVNISDIIPRSKTTSYADTTLDLCILSKSTIALCELEIIHTPELPTIYILGDSTVTDQNTSYPYHPGTSYCGWGQMLTGFLKPSICVSNHAHSGLTSETFRSEGHYDIIKRCIKPNDFVLMQFGHNDQKLPHLAAFEGYTNKLTSYIHELREMGALPILVTPLSRNTWRSDGNYNDLLMDYANACIHLSKAENIPLIDLHSASEAFIKAHGLEDSKAYFFPNDYTHTNDYGGVQMAAFVATELKGFNFFSSFVADNINQYVHSFCQSAAQVKLPNPSEDYIETTQDSHTVTFSDLEDCENQDIIVTLAAKGIISNRETVFRPNDFITRIEALEWVIKAVGFVPMNVYNDYYSDVIGHEWYAGIVEVAHQNGIVDASLTQNQLFHPNDYVTTEELISFLINSYKCRKQLKLDLQNANQVLEYVSPFALTAIQTALMLNLLSLPFSPHEKLTRTQSAHYINKLMSLF